jgi:hypothetical protein
MIESVALSSIAAINIVRFILLLSIAIAIT